VPAGKPETPSPASPAASAAQPEAKRATLAGKVIALVSVLALMVLFFAPTLRIFLDQQQSIALKEAEIREKQAQIDELKSELERWSDPAYVKAQARSRLGWVMPGETGYRVVDANGDPITTDVELDSQGSDSQLPGKTWWAKMWGSIETADQPTVKR
jgi:cell division protein FtsB